MMKSILIFLTLFSFYSFTAQNVVVQIKDVLGDDKGKVNSSFTITNKEDGSFALFIKDTRSTRAYLYDKDFNELGTISGKKIPEENNFILGYTVTDLAYQIFTFEGDTRSVVRLTYNFQNKEVTKKKLGIDLNEERYLKYFSLGEKLYLLTLDKKSSNIIHYAIDKSGSVAKHKIILEGSLYNDDGKEMTLKKILNYNKLAKVLPEGKTTIKQAAELVKLYLLDEQHLILTVDYNNILVNVFNISLENFTVNEQTFIKPKPKHQENKWKTNSFIKDNYLFQIVSSKREMIVSITNMTDSTLVKTIQVDRSDIMSFTNSPMIVQKLEVDKELNSTSQFLRKISAGQNGIAVSKIGSNYQITIGGKYIISNGGGGMNLGMGMANAGGGTFGTFQFMMASNSSFATQNTSVECIFDTSFNHIPNVDATPLLMKRRDFLNPEIRNVAETFFNIDDSYFLGMYYKEADMYVIRKF